MAAINAKSTSQTCPPAGAWQLAPGRALTLRSARGGRVRVASGGLWATFDGPHAGPANDRGDHLLQAGEVIALAPGERLVVEGVSRTAGVFIEWEPAAAATTAATGATLERRGAPGTQPGGWLAASALRLLLARVAAPHAGPPA